MKLGTGLFTCQHHPDDRRSLDAVYDEILDLGRADDDDAGLDSVWVGRDDG